MLQKQKHTTIRYKITISYIILVLLGSAAISILYKGIHNIILLDTDTSKPNFKLKYINQILTDVYEAEGFSRSYFLFRKDTDLVQYVRISDEIGKGIDSLRIVCISNTNQVSNLDEIKGLLDKKQTIINQLITISKTNQPDLSYSRVFDEVYLNTYENLSQPLIVQGTTSIKRDSTYSTTDKDGIFRRVKKIFSSTKKTDKNQLLKTTVEQFTDYDTIYQPVQISDTMLKNLKKALVNFRNRNEFIQQQSVSQETQLLHSDKIILDKIRSIVSSLETEEIIHTSSFLDKSRIIIKQANYSVIILGVLALFLVFTFLVIIYRDISRNKAYEMELMKARQHSEELVKMKEQFVASVSHEIRTPLSAIIGFSEQLKKSKTPEAQNLCAENIKMASHNLHALVNNILDISKSNAGKIELEHIAFNLKETLNEVHITFSNEALRKNIDFQIHLDENTNCTVYGDKYRFVQIINNLINNAIKFTDYGMVDLVAKINPIENNITQAEIIVFDTGIGIPASKLDSIFEEFTQADSDITRKFGGTGLGLSIAKKLAMLMNGNISVSSIEEEGSTFVVHIPFDTTGETTGNLDSQPVEIETLKNINILVVEDDETLQTLVSQLFNNNNLNGKIASNGNLALKLINSEHFDIIFTDIQMPEMSGIELCATIKDTWSSNIPVIAFSAKTYLAENYKENGFDGFLSKPFSENDFLKAIAETLQIQFPATNKKNKPNYEEFDAKKEYSFNLLREFTGEDIESLRTIVRTFIDNTNTDLELIRTNILKAKPDKIAYSVHKLLPMFRQLSISNLIDQMQMIEKYEELGLQPQDVLLFAESFVEKASKILEELINDQIFIRAEKHLS